MLRYTFSEGLEHFSTSARTGEGILDLFVNLAKSILNQHLIYNALNRNIEGKEDIARKTNK